MEHSNKIEGIGFENFRIFKGHTKFDFRNLTILTGTNNSGKSTIINGLRLIKENFCGGSGNITLAGLFNTEFNVGDISRRFGSLQKFVTFKSVYNQFTFSMQRELEMINDYVDIIFTVQIQDNKLKNGKLVKLEMVSHKSGLTIFSINKIERLQEEKSKERLVSKIDLNFFYKHYIDWINNLVSYNNEFNHLLARINDNSLSEDDLRNAVNEINNRHNSKIYILNNNPNELEEASENIERWKGDLREIIKCLNEGKFYDFSCLWAYDPSHKALFEKLIENVYGEYSTKSLNKLRKGIIDNLSNQEWEDDQSSNLTSDSLGILGISHIYFKGKKANIDISGLTLQSYSQYLEKWLIDEDVYFLDEESINEIKTQEDLISYLINLLIDRFKNDRYEPIYFRDDERDKLLQKIRENPFTSSIAERYFYNDFIFHNLNLITNSFRPFENLEFVSTERSNSKRVKSLLDEDDISKLSRKLFSFKPEQFEQINDFMNNWLKEFSIADEIIFEKDPDSDNFKIYFKRIEDTILLSDMGYGVSQLIPIILACYPLHEFDFTFHDFSIVQKVIAVEEPETNLHPALQSKLADFFIEASKKFQIQFIIETHSEYLIRKLQFLTAKDKVKKEDIVIYYFYHPDKLPLGEDQVKEIQISDDGSLTDDFGTGFFDEADNIALDLFLLNKTQKN